MAEHWDHFDLAFSRPRVSSSPLAGAARMSAATAAMAEQMNLKPRYTGVLDDPLLRQEYAAGSHCGGIANTPQNRKWNEKPASLAQLYDASVRSSEHTMEEALHSVLDKTTPHGSHGNGFYNAALVVQKNVHTPDKNGGQQARRDAKAEPCLVQTYMVSC